MDIFSEFSSGIVRDKRDRCGIFRNFPSQTARRLPVGGNLIRSKEKRDQESRV